MANYCTSHSAKNETYRHETSERHVLHRHILTAMTKQCNHKQKTRNISLFVGSVQRMCSSREAVTALPLPVTFLWPVPAWKWLWEKQDSGSCKFLVPDACRAQFTSHQNQCSPSALDWHVVGTWLGKVLTPIIS